MITSAAILILAAANCAALPIPDQRAYCQALQSGQSHYCTQIANYAIRQQCRAEIDGRPADCNLITDANQRQICKARVRT